MGEAQILKTEGEDLVVLSRRDYDRLLASAGDEAAEDRMSVRILEESRGLTTLPLAYMERILDGEAVVAVLLACRGLTSAELAARTGLSQACIADLVGGTVRPDGTAIDKLCAALNVSPDVFEV